MEITKVVTCIKASEGKVLRRKSDGQIFSDARWLGNIYYLNGEKLDEPLWELPEHYEEIDMPEDWMKDPNEVEDVENI